MHPWLVMASAAMLLGAATPPPVTFTSYTRQFDTFAAATEQMPREQRVAAFRAKFDSLMPGLYTASDPARLDRRIARALEEFPSLRPSYHEVERNFPVAFATAASRFRAVFPDFVSPLPIYLVHELGVRDGGSDYVDGRKVMLFGADVIAKIHNDDSLQPFLTHELFHLEHGRHFADCNQLWCLLWQEGLATYAASAITPDATDHQLLLDQPTAIRPAVDAHWNEALCLVAGKFEATDDDTLGAAFSSSSHPPGLPARFGYYVGLKVATEAARIRTLPQLSRLDNSQARPVVVAALTDLITKAHAACPPPSATAAATPDRKS